MLKFPNLYCRHLHFSRLPIFSTNNSRIWIFTGHGTNRYVKGKNIARRK